MKFTVNGVIASVQTSFMVTFIELVLRATNDLELFGKFSYKTTQLIEQEAIFDGNPLYSIMQENLYCHKYVTSRLSFISCFSCNFGQDGV